MNRRTRSTKAELHGQVFSYVLAFILVVLLLVFGFQGFSTMQDASLDQQAQEFIELLSQTIDANARQIGKVSAVTFSIDHDYLCLADYDAPAFPPPVIPDEMVRALIRDQQGSGDNAFLVKDLSVWSFSVPKLQLEQRVLCVEGGTQLSLEGTGPTTVVRAG